jgi:hypothetical protein
MTIRSALLMIGIWVILAFSTVHSFQATLLRRSDNTDTHTALLIKTAHRMSAIDLAILLLLGGLRALLVRQEALRAVHRPRRVADRDCHRRAARAVRERIALRGDEPGAASLRLGGDAPAGRYGPGGRLAEGHGVHIPVTSVTNVRALLLPSPNRRWAMG